MAGTFREMEKIGFPKEPINGMLKAVDCRLFFFEHEVEIPTMYLVLAASIVVLILLYILLNKFFSRRTK